MHSSKLSTFCLCMELSWCFLLNSRNAHCTCIVCTRHSINKLLIAPTTFIIVCCVVFFSLSHRSRIGISNIFQSSFSSFLLYLSLSIQFLIIVFRDIPTIAVHWGVDGGMQEALLFAQECFAMFIQIEILLSSVVSTLMKLEKQAITDMLNLWASRCLLDNVYPLLRPSRRLETSTKIGPINVGLRFTKCVSVQR